MALQHLRESADQPIVADGVIYLSWTNDNIEVSKEEMFAGPATSLANATIDAGQSVDFTGSVGGKGKKSCDWTFDGGVPASATDCTVSVSYANAGPYIARLDGTASKENPPTCFDEVTVTVNAGGGKTAPTANDDSYSATTDVTLNVSASPPPVALSTTVRLGAPIVMRLKSSSPSLSLSV